MYANGEVPAGLLVQRPSAGKDPCLMMPGTAAKHDRLVELGAAHGWVPLVSGPADAYRTLGVQENYWDTMPSGQAAYPSTSSHGGTYDFEDGRGKVEQGAVDYGNWGEIGWGLFQQLTREAGFTPGVFIGRPGIPDEYWHVFDPTPWDVPATPATKTEEGDDDMRAIRKAGVPDSGIIIQAGVPPYSLGDQVFQALVGAYGLTVVELADWQYDTAQREQWTAFSTAQRFAKDATLSQADIDKIANATRDALGGVVTAPKA